MSSVVDSDGRPMFRDFAVQGRTVSFEIDYDSPRAAAGERLTFAPRHGEPRQGPPASLGIQVRRRVGGGNTAYHVPEGMLLAYGAGVRPDHSRRRVSILDVAPSLLGDFLGVEPPPTMRGDTGLFRPGAGHDPVRS